MATAKQRKAYERKLREISRNFGSLERSTLRQSIELLKDVRNQVAGQLTGTDFSQFRVAEQQKALDDIIADYEEQARELANGASRQSYKLGDQSVTDPLKAANVNVAFFKPSKAQVEVLAQFSADLIGGVSDVMRTKINRSIRMNALAGNSSLDAMRDITGILGIPAKASDPTKGVAYEAERILRTETNRTYNLASNAQQEALAEDVPGLQKQWIATGDARTRLSHLQAHGQIVDVGKPFIVGGEKLMYPLDPKGGPHETINCRCTSITVIPEIGPLESPLDAEIEAEKERRGVDKQALSPPRFDRVEDAENWLNESGIFSGTVDLELVKDPKVANRISSEFAQLAQSFPGPPEGPSPFGGISVVSPDEMGTVFADSTFGHIRLNAAYWQNESAYRRWASRTKEGQFVNVSPSATIRHEFAHAMDVATRTPEQSTKIERIFSDWVRGQDVNNFRLSRYALANDKEMLAEAFVEWTQTETRTGGHGLRAQGLGQLVDIFEEWTK